MNDKIHFYMKFNLVINMVWSYVLVIWLLIGEKTMEMSFIQTLIIAVVPTVIAVVATYATTKQSQIKENTNELNKLRQCLGLREDQTLQSQITGQFESISNDIGRRDNASLTKQHQEIETCIEKSFAVIQDRYDKEDNTYRKFEAEQYDLKIVLDNFIKDYEEQVSQRAEIEARNGELLQKIEKLKLENQSLKSQLMQYQQQEIYMQESSDEEWER